MYHFKRPFITVRRYPYFIRYLYVTVSASTHHHGDHQEHHSHVSKVGEVLEGGKECYENKDRNEEGIDLWQGDGCLGTDCKHW